MGRAFGLLCPVASLHSRAVSFFFISIVVFAVQGLAQSGYEPPPPLAATSAAECDEYGRAMNARISDLSNAAARCQNNLERQCDALPTANEQFGCYGRIQMYLRRAPECGNNDYTSSEYCKAIAHDEACAEYRKGQYLQQCRFQVRDYENRQAQYQVSQRQMEAQHQASQQAALNKLGQRQESINNVTNALTQIFASMQKSDASEESDEGDVGTAPETPVDIDREPKVEPNRQRYPQERNDSVRPGQPSVDDTVDDLLAPSSASAGQPAVDASINDLLASNEVPLNPASTVPGTEQPSVDASMADLLGSEDTQAEREKAADAQKELADLALKFVVSAADEWKAVKEFQEVTEPLTLAADSLSMATAAYDGEVPSTIPGLKQLEQYLTKQNDALSLIGKRSVEDWEKASGINAFDRSTVESAQSYLDNLSQRLTTLQGLSEHLLAAANSAQAMLENPAVNDLRMVKNMNTMPTADSMFIWNYIIPELNGCLRKIGTIKSNIYDARSVVR